ncbi:MAG: sigma-70 family RNA polymerase sigma factor [Planctomycetaceae bacterium]|nr:sigma-70 family RNA polymerase sigma factor [Planctomycetaceae bacterium]
MGNNGHPSPNWIRSVLAQYEDRLLRYAQRIVRDEALARDVVQETFLKLCHQDPAELNGRLAQWLYTVCRNQSVDLVRKESRMSTMLAETPPVAASASPPGDHVERLDEMERVRTEIEQLTDSQQECLRLKFEHGLSYREIAEITGLSESNVGFTIHTGLKKLRTRLAEKSGNG